MESKTNLKELKDQINQFVKERDWEKFNTAKDVGIALSIEVGELLDHFKWKTRPEVIEMLKDADKRQEIKLPVSPAHPIRLFDSLIANRRYAFGYLLDTATASGILDRPRIGYAFESEEAAPEEFECEAFVEAELICFNHKAKQELILSDSMFGREILSYTDNWVTEYSWYEELGYLDNDMSCVLDHGNGTSYNVLPYDLIYNYYTSIST